jgi:hypothetical protein
MKRSDMRRKASCALVAKAAASFCLQRAKRKANLAFGPFSAPKRLKRWGRRQDLRIVAPSSRAAEGRPRGRPSPDRLWRRFLRRHPGNYNLASHAAQRTEKARFGRNQSRYGKGPILRSARPGCGPPRDSKPGDRWADATPPIPAPRCRRRAGAPRRGWSGTG